jgi:hypothetical protein
MDEGLRVAINKDWITVILALCFTVIALCEYFSQFSFTRSWIRFSTVPGGTSSEKSTLRLTFSVMGRLFLFVTMLSLFIFEAAHYYLEKNDNLNLYMSIWIIVGTFMIALNYLTKLISHVCKFEAESDQVIAMRNFQRGLLSYAFFMIYIVYFYSFSNIYAHIIFVTILVLCLVNFIILLYRLRWYILGTPLYFILYLCTLEIAPYLLLYKYIIV